MGNATRKQIDALRKMGYAVAEDISFEDASRIFDEHKAKRTGITQPEAPKEQPKEQKGYHLTPEQVRTNAIEAAQRWYPSLPNDVKEIEMFWRAVHQFEKYINANI